MPSTTTLGINHPVGPDRYNATNAFTTLATTTDAAIRRAVDENKGSMTEYVDTAVADNRQWVENVVAASALGDMTPEQVDAAVERVLSSSAWKDRQAEVVHVRDFGAKGDGITDDSAAIQAAIDTGRNVEFSNVPYRITKGFTVPSGTVLNGNGAQLVSTGSVGNVFTIAGSASATTVNLAGTYDSGDALLRTVTPHGLTEGDVFRLVGQRASASSDAPTDDRLGMSTGNSGVPWFGEYVRVRKVLSPTEFTTMSGLIFNGYRDNRLQETLETARERTTLNRMNWASDIVVRDFEIDTASNYAFRMDYAKDCIISNVREKRRANTGYVVGATGCYRCLVADVSVDFASPIPDGFTDYWLRNPFKLMGCQSVSIDRCSADGGEQVVDFTYIASAMIPTIACSVRNCTFYGYDTNAVTAHPGVWGSVIENNDFRAANTVKTASSNGSAVASGIGIRSPYSVIRGNQIRTDQRNEGTSDGNWGNYGINLYDAGGHHCQVTGNQVYGPDIGIGVTDGNESPERHGTLYTMIDGNYVEDAMVGIRLRKSGLTNVWSAATIQGNYVASKWANAVGISLDISGTGKTKAASAIGNRLHFTGTSPTPFHLGSAVNPVLISNVVTGTASSLWSGDNAPVMAANVVISESGVTQYPAPGATGTVSVASDAVSGAYRIGAGSSTVRVPSVDDAGALTGATRTWVEGLVSNAANLGQAMTVAQDARAAAARAEQIAAAASGSAWEKGLLTVSPDSLTASGFYRATSTEVGAYGLPTSGGRQLAGFLEHWQVTSISAYQEFTIRTTGERWWRYNDGSTWTAWTDRNAPLTSRLSALESRTTAIETARQDTKWRDVTALLTPARTSGRVLLRRQGGVCRLVFDQMVFAAAGSGTLVILPTGFRPAVTEPNTAQGLSLRVQVTIYGNVQAYAWTTAPVVGSLTWFCDEPHPATSAYPGTPV